jgi:hypothetical protein
LFENSFRLARFKPFAHQTFRQRAERFTTSRARTHYLHEAAQHLAVINHARENPFEQILIFRSQNRDEQCGHIFHITFFACENSKFRNEFGVDFLRQRENFFKLFVRVGVESVIKTTRRRVLGESRFRRKLISRAARFVNRVSLRREHSFESLK